MTNLAQYQITGLPDTNVEGDLVVEHWNGDFKVDLKIWLKFVWFYRLVGLICFLVGTTFEQLSIVYVVARGMCIV